MILFEKIFSKKICNGMLYRRPMFVEKYKPLGNFGLFAVCPRCELTIERDYQAYCDRCGQCLKWV